ncbi:hypothetical protein H839_15162 [Parageobacillus genomosp. 1]|uniref:Uncharacterized protein n=1 Tax=Parageobacillus genomosp. 1 TaxID=1295642 RepID=A0ABC9VBA5_9BACL|nr:hypothetical protein [Parageobacillus genomosp. 1]EZP75451.1 hypothetical protein H839_15162 [Parageobacillus genomosp. 1]
MKNVVIHKIVTFIFTEEQLKAYWDRQNPHIPFASLTNEQYMKLAEDMLHHSSHSQLKQHLIGAGWCTEDEANGLVLAEDESRYDIHVEIVDTSVPAEPTKKLFIDHVTEIQCPHCSFSFYLRDTHPTRSDWTCPACGNAFHTSS